MKSSRGFVAVLTLVMLALACNLPGSSGTVSPVEETRVALAVQQTSLAQQQATFDAHQSTSNSQLPPATYTPFPTFAPDTAPQPAAVTSTRPAADISSLIRASNILIFEDIVGDPSLIPIVDRTVNAMNFSGGKVINTGDAMGKFRGLANSATPWDLIIVAAEARSGFSGELFEMMYDHLDEGGAVIIEMWHLDKVVSGKIAPILHDCGEALFRDWDRDAVYDPYKYSIYWLDTTHRLLSTPNNVQAPSYPYPVWFGDVGDLLELGSGGDAVLVGGLNPNRKSDYGVLASCLGGRMVIQTFSSHDYEMEIMQPLWENYITYTLMNHYGFNQ